MGSRRKPASTGAGGGRGAPPRNPDFAHLTLEQLRTYRAALGAEETRVSYWRRVVQARLDILRAGLGAGPGGGPGGGVDPEHLRGLLTDGRCASPRRAFLAIVPADDIPPLPDLCRLWAEGVRPDDRAHTARLERDLAAAEEQLSAYRGALHRRLGAATAELIARYAEEPALALAALPVTGPATGSPTGPATGPATGSPTGPARPRPPRARPPSGV